jgi:hypothetical protein
MAKKKRRGSVNFDEMKNKLGGEKKTYEVDPRLYIPQVNEKGKFSAVIRFLPSPDPANAIQPKFRHFFQANNGKYFVENCPSSVNANCPVCDDAWDNWKNLTEGEKKKRKNRLPKRKHITNILVIKAPATPENEGKVFLYECDMNIMNKIELAVKPDEDSIFEPIPFNDYYKGANFNLIGTENSYIDTNGNKKTGTSWENSSFVAPSPLEEDVIDKADEDLISLDEFRSEDYFSTFAELKAKLEEFQGTTATKAQLGESNQVDTDSDSDAIESLIDNKEEVEDDDESGDDFMKQLQASMDN